MKSFCITGFQMPLYLCKGIRIFESLTLCPKVSTHILGPLYRQTCYTERQQMTKHMKNISMDNYVYLYVYMYVYKVHVWRVK